MTLFDGAVAGQLGALGASVSVQDYRWYVLHGDVHEVGGGRAHIRFNCYGIVDPWQTIFDAVPKTVSFVGELHAGFVLARGDASPFSFIGLFPQGRTPPGPLLRCALDRNLYGDLQVTLRAYLSN